MPSAYDLVMDSRKELVEKLIRNMEQGYLFTRSQWNRAAFAPYNPSSEVFYKGGNRIRLINQVLEHGYQDPRWMTVRQMKQEGYYVKKGEHGTLCEKWIFEKEKTVEKEDGTKEVVREPLEPPAVRYFLVFNGEQIQDFPAYVPESRPPEKSLEAGLECLASSECQIVECAQPDAFYSPRQDKIFLPLRSVFKDPESFIKTGLHEMVHSTGHPLRLNREMGGPFGSESYAREELRAEIGAMFLEADLALPVTGEHFQDHSNYLQSWIAVLKKDYNELFRACADAEKAAGRIRECYLQYKKNGPDKEQTTEKKPERKQEKIL